jgi:hypothetical protein
MTASQRRPAGGSAAASSERLFSAMNDHPAAAMQPDFFMGKSG